MIDTLKSEEFDNVQNEIGHYCLQADNLIHFFIKNANYIKKRSGSDTISIFSLEGLDLL